MWLRRLKGYLPAWMHDRLPPGSLMLESGYIAGGTGAGQAVLLVASPVLTRLYAPDDFGVLAVYASALTILLVVASLRWELAIPLPERDDVAINLLVLAFASLLTVSALSAAGSYFLGPQLANRLGFDEFLPYLWVLPVGVAAGGAYQLLNYWAIRHQDYKEVGKSKFGQNTGEAVIQVALGFTGVGTIGLLIGDVVGRFGGSGGLLRPLLARDRGLFSEVSVSRLKQSAVRYRRFPLIASTASLFNSAGAQLPPILLAAVYGSAEAGLFMVASRVVAAPVALIGRGVSQVYMGNVASFSAAQSSQWRRLVRRICGGMLVLGIPPAVLLATAGVPIFELIFGTAWSSAGRFARVLSLILLAQLVVGPVSQTLNVLERQSTQLLWDVARLSVVAGSIVIPARFGAEVTTAVTIYAVATSLMYGLLLSVSYRAIGLKGQKGESS